ncbi:MAG TPA: OmpA family protein [Anaeromyxobacteraceae bacterium]|nr:OmpA family protein [Anaeromyxobacteraceae bacterium]
MRLHAWCLAAVVPLAASCAHTRKEAKAEAPPPAPVAAVTPPPAPVAPPAVMPAAPEERTCTGDAQCDASELCVASKCIAITAGVAECTTPSVHFDFDRADLHPADLPELQRAARCLKALPPERTLVEGNCDERGTVEYNLALGLRRAHSVTKYLEDVGVPAAQLQAVSYGKELPVCTTSAESCWAQNRRADVSRGAEPKDVTAMIRADERRERISEAGASGSQAAAARRPAQVRRGAAQPAEAPRK